MSPSSLLERGGLVHSLSRLTGAGVVGVLPRPAGAMNRDSCREFTRRVHAIHADRLNIARTMAKTTKATSPPKKMIRRAGVFNAI